MAGKKSYRIAQIEGKISFQVEELWEGGKIRGPYGSKESAQNSEESHARQEGFIDDLVLEAAIEAKISHKDAFVKDDEGNWLCIQGCSIEMDNKEIAFVKGMKFTPGDTHMGLDVARWLENN
jgi:hypothetical protein